MTQVSRSRQSNCVRKNLWLAAGMICLAASYYVFYKITGLAFPCLWYEITGWYCPGCGVTRMLEALLYGNLYQALRFNPLLFILLPFGVVLLIDWLLHDKTQCSTALVNRIPKWFWIGLIIIAITFGILRNLPIFEFLAPTAVWFWLVIGCWNNALLVRGRLGFCSGVR